MSCGCGCPKPECQRKQQNGCSKCQQKQQMPCSNFGCNSCCCQNPNECSMFGANCKCIRPPTPPIVEPEPRCCPYLVCPCPDPCIIPERDTCVKRPEDCCANIGCNKVPTGYNLSCKSCNRNCPVETYCPVPKSCLPRCTPNCPQRYPHHPWAQIDTRHYNAL
ncbi:hypothetical protein HELRODRAFT_160498 [Helobdella robusta]|uniref:Uncharacterized protein n=1 Tax=Helobdella robusta TaxID=6412 RepID=T1EQB7_HELRO|nr:hypothetical protein HELRODRAFT_160498 [Helobdella robusta]ESO06334.1 hypothetical protein HELRODRAFT_160498 [Helobdella robusta]